MAGLPPHPPHLNFTALATTPLRSMSTVPTRPPSNDHHMTSMAIFILASLDGSLLSTSGGVLHSAQWPHEQEAPGLHLLRQARH